MRRLSRASKTTPEIKSEGLYISDLTKVLPDGRVLFSDVELYLRTKTLNSVYENGGQDEMEESQKENEEEEEEEEAKEDEKFNADSAFQNQYDSFFKRTEVYSINGNKKQTKIIHKMNLNKRQIGEGNEEDRKEIITIRGPSGCGKTTLLRCIAQLEQYSDGAQVFLNGKSPEDMGIPEWRSRVLYVPQRTPNLPGTPRDFWKSIKKFATQRKRNSYSYVPMEIASYWHLPEDVWDKDWTQLSGGEMQRAMLAIAVSRNPEILLLDEPTSALDHETTLAVEKTLKKMNCIWITHSLEQEKRVATQTLLLSKMYATVNNV